MDDPAVPPANSARDLPTKTELLEAVEIEIHPQAEKLARQYVDEFATTLLLQAKLLAYSRRDDAVLSNHIESALNAIRQKADQQRSRDFGLTIGGVLLGAFIQGFITELSAGRTLWIAVYTILGFFGVFLFFWGLRR